jgi:hypothetical protein
LAVRREVQVLRVVRERSPHKAELALKVVREWSAPVALQVLRGQLVLQVLRAPKDPQEHKGLKDRPVLQVPPDQLAPLEQLVSGELQERKGQQGQLAHKVPKGHKEHS